MRQSGRRAAPPSDRPGTCGRGSRLNGPRATVPPREGRGRRRREIALTARSHKGHSRFTPPGPLPTRLAQVYAIRTRYE
ncbi:MAG TPA: hypothetical protein VFT66_16625 [Roseiflexaceae bacterium]|nr:hypothetical protein [Roseiflexaceae bacterium]